MGVQMIAGTACLNASLSCNCCVLPGSGLCDGLIPCPEESYGCVCCGCYILVGSGLCVGLIPCPEESYECLSVVGVTFWQVEVFGSG